MNAEDRSKPIAGTDANIWNKFCQGDKKAEAYIFTTYQPILLRYAVRRLGCDFEEARDGIQDLFMYLCEHRNNLGPTNRIKPYLKTSFKRKLFKKAKHQHEIAYSRLGYKDQEYANSLTDETESRELQDYVRKVCDLLPEKQREAITLRFFMGFSVKECAKKMNTSVSYAKTLTHRTIDRLRKKIRAGTSDIPDHYFTNFRKKSQ